MPSWLNAVIIPCRNEATSIESVIANVRRVSPDSLIVVVDNGSTDATAQLAKNAGAVLLSCAQAGKGRAIKFALDRIQADSYTLIDGDGTYDVSRLPEMIKAIQNGASMSVGVRRARSKKSYPRFHHFGNWLFSTLLSLLFGKKANDVLSGLRVLSHEFALYSPLMVKGFEVEAFYTLEASIRDVEVKEFEIDYYERGEGSHSKLRSFSDGFRILRCILGLFRTYRPMPFFLILSVICFSLGILSGLRPIMEYMNEGYVYAVPRAVLAAALVNLSFITLGFGLTLSSQMTYHLKNLEVKRALNKERATPSSITPAA